VCVSPPTRRCKKAVRPDPCCVCGAPSWWNGGRVVAEVLHDLGQGVRRVIDVLRRRARCSDRRCAAGSWTIYPAGVYPHRSYQLCVVAAASGEVSRAGSVLRLLDHLSDVLLRRGVALPGRGPGLVRVLTAQLARFGDVAWLTRSSPPLRVATETVPL